MPIQLPRCARIVNMVVLALGVLVARDASGQVQTGDSSVGYIDSALVQTQLRLRFDAAFDNDRPDRSEFFYAKCGCFRELGVDPNAPGPAPPLDGRDPNTTRFIETNVDYQEAWVDLEYALARDFSIFVEVPFRFLDPTVNADAAGLSDVRAGFKWALFASPWEHLTFQLRTYIPTGEAIRGLGTDHVSLEPAFLYNKQLDERLTFEAEFRDWIPISPSSGVPTDHRFFAGNILRYGVGVAYDVYECQCGKKITPVVEVVGWTVLDGLSSSSTDGTLSTFVLEDASGDTIANLKLGVRMATSHCDSWYIGYGRALTEEVWYEDVVRLEYRRTF